VPVRIRDFRTLDFETLWQIDQICFPAGISYSQSELGHYVHRPRGFTLVAEAQCGPRLDANQMRSPAGKPPRTEGADPAGPAFLRFAVAERNARGAGHILTIDVLPEARRLGVGSALMAEVEGRLRTARCRYVFLETAVNNSAALAFYKRRDYELVKTIPRYYQNSLDAFLLTKRLS